MKLRNFTRYLVPDEDESIHDNRASWTTQALGSFGHPERVYAIFPEGTSKEEIRAVIDASRDVLYYRAPVGTFPERKLVEHKLVSQKAYYLFDHIDIDFLLSPITVENYPLTKELFQLTNPLLDELFEAFIQTIDDVSLDRLLKPLKAVFVAPDFPDEQWKEFHTAENILLNATVKTLQKLLAGMVNPNDPHGQEIENEATKLLTLIIMDTPVTEFFQTVDNTRKDGLSLSMLVSQKSGDKDLDSEFQQMLDNNYEVNKMSTDTELMNFKNEDFGRANDDYVWPEGNKHKPLSDEYGEPLWDSKWDESEDEDYPRDDPHSNDYE